MARGQAHGEGSDDSGDEDAGAGGGEPVEVEDGGLGGGCGNGGRHAQDDWSRPVTWILGSLNLSSHWPEARSSPDDDADGEDDPGQAGAEDGAGAAGGEARRGGG